MQLLLNSKLSFFCFGVFLATLTSAQEKEANDVPECPSKITIKNGSIIGASGWDYSIDSIFIDEKTKDVLLKDGFLVSDFPLPEITHINKHTKSVTGGLSSSSEEVTENTEIYTWDIQEINKSSRAVFYCDLHGDRNETPVPFVLIYKEVPEHIKTCTVTYKSENDNRIPESQTLECR